MHVPDVPAKLAFLAFLGLPTIAISQDAGRREDVPTCHGANSRLVTGCRKLGPPRILRDEIEVETPPLRIARPQSGACHAEMSLEYLQWDTAARVRSKIENADCAASRGQYVLEVTVRDSKGELKTLRIRESWSRNDDQPVVSMKDYPIGENVDLVSVRSRRLQCSCVGKIEP